MEAQTLGLWLASGGKSLRQNIGTPLFGRAGMGGWALSKQPLNLALVLLLAQIMMTACTGACDSRQQSGRESCIDGCPGAPALLRGSWESGY